MESPWLNCLINRCQINKFLMILLLSFSMPALASFAVPQEKSFTAQIINSYQTTITTSSNSENLISLATEFESVDTLNTFQKTIEFNPKTNSKKTDYRAPALMRDSLLFRESVQCNPIYCLVVEFNPPDPSIRSIPDFRINDKELPWYLTAVQKSNGRLSSWKDGNSLYTSRTTYH